MKNLRISFAAAVLAATLAGCAGPGPTAPRAAPPNGARDGQADGTPTVKSDPINPAPTDTTGKAPPGQTFGSGT